MVLLTTSLVHFLVSLAISTLIIFIITKILGEEEGIFTALLAAFFGALISIFSVVFLGNGIWVYVIATIIWLLALRTLYSIGWLKSILIAILIGVVSAVVSLFI